MRILIAGQTYAPALNGQAVFMTNLAEGLAGSGHHVMVLTPKLDARGQPYERNGVVVQPIGSIPLDFFHAQASVTLAFNPHIEKALKAFRPDVVHVHDHYPISWDVIRLARRYGVKVIGTNHFMPQNLAPYMPLSEALKTFYEKLMWWWMLLTYNHLDVVTGPSRTAVAIMRRNGLEVPAYPVSCGINMKRFRPLREDQEAVRLQMFERYRLDLHKKTFMFVGRVDAEKRVDLLLRALHHLERDDIQLVVAGKGAAFSNLQMLAQKLNLGERTHFVGFIPYEDLPGMLNSIDVFVLPSEAELLSIASLEAMACALPLLLARSQALPELVDQGVNGYLFEPGNVEDISHYMALLADHPQMWHGMGVASLKKVQAHSVENTLRSYEKLYDGLLVDSLARPHRLSRQRARRIWQTTSNIRE